MKSFRKELTKNSFHFDFLTWKTLKFFIMAEHKFNLFYQIFMVHNLVLIIPHTLLGLFVSFGCCFTRTVI